MPRATYVIRAKIRRFLGEGRARGTCNWFSYRVLQ